MRTPGSDRRGPESRASGSGSSAPRPAVIGQSLAVDRPPSPSSACSRKRSTIRPSGRAADFYIPMASEPSIRRQSWLKRPDFNWLAIIGRLSLAARLPAAQANLDPIFARFLDEHSRTIADPASRKSYLSQRLVLESARAGLSDLRRQFSRPVLLLMTAVTPGPADRLHERGEPAARPGRRPPPRDGAATGDRRQPRTADPADAHRIGAARSRGRCRRLRAVAGGRAAAGARWSRMVRRRSTCTSPPTAGVLLFTMVVAVGASILAGLVPGAADGTRSTSPPTSTPARGRCRPRAGRRRWSRALIAAQVALSLLLLIGAALVLTSLRNMRTFDAGFDRRARPAGRSDTDRAGYTGERMTPVLPRRARSGAGAPGRPCRRVSR